MAYSSLRPRKRAASRTFAALPLRALITRVSVLLWLMAACVIIAMSKADSQFAHNLRTGITDIFVPVLGAAAQPVDAIAQFGQNINNIANVYDENKLLKEENARLLQWQVMAKELRTENDSLKKLVKFAPQNLPSYVTARIVADGNGPYARSAVLGAGSSHGVAKYQPVINEKGLVGRVMEVGGQSSRVLLITDINSRIPVVGEDSHERSIAAGDNTELLTLTYLPEHPAMKVGERVVTSSDGTVLPSGLPVGVVESVESGIVKIRPLVDWYRLDYVSVVDFTF